MASRSLDDLKKTMSRKANQFLGICALADMDVLIYCTLRSAEEQSRLYRQGRNIRTIRGKADELREHNPALGDLLMSVGPQHGPKVTGAGPGQSLHQYGWAFDGVPMRDGKACWSADDPMWQIYGECAVKAGLEWAGNWTKFTEFPHCQEPGKDWRKLIRGLKV